ncbi:hypothetical protein EDD15DRAFT_2195942 [Pisolithus albus]|nr:hypothetical protein EDD15DRAFT_2195942 [Pisolithus albus]
MDGPGVGTMAIPRNSWTGPSKVSGDMTMRRTKDALALAAIAGDTFSGTISAIRALVPRKVNAARAGIAASSLGGSRLVVLGAICRGNIFPWGPYAAQNSHGAHMLHKVSAAGAGIVASSLRGSRLVVLGVICSGTMFPRGSCAAQSECGGSWYRGKLSQWIFIRGGLLWSSLRGSPQLISLGIHVPCKVSAAGAGSLMQLARQSCLMGLDQQI